MHQRTLAPQLERLLVSWRKMLFLSGPRQVGKTTLAKSFGQAHGGALYFNWDVITDQKRLAKNPYFFEEANRTPLNLVIFDEIHKYARWKNYLKGAYDKYKDDFLFLVTGSGRLDLFKRGGDSLLGRYVGLPLFPFTVTELANVYVTWGEFLEHLTHGAPTRRGNARDYQALYELSGFPEPLFRGEKSAYNIWHQERKTLLLREDIRDATAIRDISLLEYFSHLLAQRIGSPLSINALREDVGVAFDTARDWLQILAQFYYVFMLPPFTGSLKRTLRKETKVYLFDWAELDDPGLRFENLVAAHLLKSVKTWKALGDGELSLCYLRDKEKREVDFVIVEKNRPRCLIEAKLSDEECAPSLLYYQEKLDVPVAVQVLHKPGVERKMRKNNKIQWIVSADRWLAALC